MTEDLLLGSPPLLPGACLEDRPMPAIWHSRWQCSGLGGLGFCGGVGVLKATCKRKRGSSRECPGMSFGSNGFFKKVLSNQEAPAIGADTESRRGNGKRKDWSCEKTTRPHTLIATSSAEKEVRRAKVAEG